MIKNLTCQINVVKVVLMKEKGIVPIVLVILLTLVIVGGGATVYSQKEVILNELPKVSSLPVVFFKPTPKPGEIITKPLKAKLAKESVNFETKGTKVEGLPNINMYPPAGWNQLSPTGADVLGFEAPDKDYVWVGKSNLWTQARISVRVTKSTGESLAEAVNQYKNEIKKLMPTVYLYENKDLIGGAEAYYLEADHDLRSIRRAQIEEELIKTGKKFSQSDLTKLLEVDMVRSATYFVQKNGYDVMISGRASAIAWDKRGQEIKKSIGSLVFIGK